MSKSKKAAAEKAVETTEMQANEIKESNETVQEKAQMALKVKATADHLIEMFNDAEDPISICQLSLATGCSYNVLLKASKAPVPGEVYDPDSVNFLAMAGCIVRKLGDDLEKFEWEDVRAVGPDANGGKAIEIKLNVGDRIKLRDVVTKDPDGNTVSTTLPEYVVHIVTPTHVVIMADGETKPRVMSLATYVHCGGQTVSAVTTEESSN